MNMTTSFATRHSIEDFPLIEEPLIKLIFRVDPYDLWISDLSNLYHFDDADKVSARLLDYFEVRVTEDEILAENYHIRNLVSAIVCTGRIPVQEEFVEKLIALQREEHGYKQRRDGFYSIEFIEEP
jgi:hypothetical protein